MSNSGIFPRRRFLQLSAAGLAGLTTRSQAAARLPLGAQLYTAREMAAKDLPGTLRQIRAIGYDEVELVSLAYHFPAGELRKTIAASGLKAPSGHFSYGEVSSRISYARDLGMRWVVCPSIPGSMWSEDGFRRAAEQFNEWGKRLRGMGMRFAYHNHNYEFHRYGKDTGFDLLTAHTDPKDVFFEIDCYWVAEAGQDPVATIKKLGSRVRLLHLKDRKPGFAPSTEMDKDAEHFTEVGSGTLDWRAILSEGERVGVEHYFVEQDEPTIPPIQSLQISYRYLRKLL